MTALGDELRLLIFLLVQTFVLFAAWRFVSRFSADWLQRAVDTLLLTYLIEYAAVMLPGGAHVLSPTAVLMVACVLAAGLLLTPLSRRGSNRKDETEPSPYPLPGYRDRDRGTLFVLLGLLFVTGYVIAYCWTQRLLPPMGTDALTYHFPAAVHWLQLGKIERFQTWFFNPANTYSPLAGSAFYAWLIGPISDDALAVHGQAPMVGLLFLAAVSIGRSLGANHLAATLAAIALCLSRPIVNQLDKGKDDLFLAAFFAVAVATIVRRRDPLSPWRLGIAIGLCLATKYTAILALPMLLLAVRRVPWKDFAIAAGCVLVIAGPWYIANWVSTYNPLFPTDFAFLNGLFSTARSLELRTASGVLGVILHGSFGVPGAVAVALAIGWLGGSIGQVFFPPQRKRILVTAGPLIGVAIFVLISPYPEVRFLLPALLLMTAALNLFPGRFATVVGGIAAIAAVVTSISEPSLVAEFAAAGAVFAAIGGGFAYLQPRLRLTRDRLAITAAVIVLLVTGYAWVNWRAFLRDRREIAIEVWSARGMPGALWRFVREELPPGELVAYTGTHLAYPLMAAHPVMHVPARRGVGTTADLPYLGNNLPGEYIDAIVKRAMLDGVDLGSWLQKLRKFDVKYVVVHRDISGPEKAWMAGMPDRFERLFEDAGGAVYRIKLPWPQALLIPMSSASRGE